MLSLDNLCRAVTARVRDPKDTFDSPLSREELTLHDVIHLIVADVDVVGLVKICEAGGDKPDIAGHTYSVLWQLTPEACDENEVVTMAVERVLLERCGIFNTYFDRGRRCAPGVESWYITLQKTGWRHISRAQAVQRAFVKLRRPAELEGYVTRAFNVMAQLATMPVVGPAAN